MADPLSISASIAGLIGLADIVYRLSSNFVNSLREPDKEVDTFLSEVETLCLILHDLFLAASDLEGPTEQPASQGPIPTSASLDHLAACKSDLLKVKGALLASRDKLSSKSMFGRPQAQLKWPFSAKETKAFLLNFERHKQTIQLGIAAESLAKLKLCLAQQQDIGAGIATIKSTVDQVLDIQTRIALDRKREEVLHFFLPPDLDPRIPYETNIDHRHPRTGLWLTKGHDFEQWYSAPGSGMWCTGIPGAGKSVLAACTIWECLQRTANVPGTAVAYFFCMFTQSRTHQPATILSALCGQLALQNEKAFGFLEQFYDQLKPDSRKASSPSEQQLTSLFLQMIATFTRIYLVVDGLDECADHGRISTRALLRLATSQNAQMLSMALFSRDDVEIQDEIESHFHRVEIEASTDDLMLYVSSELDERIASKRMRIRDPSLRDEFLVDLVAIARGMFRLVALQLDHLCGLPTDRDRKEALKKSPPSLYEFYDRQLLRLESCVPETQDIVRKTLLILASAQNHRITMSQLCELASLSEDTQELEEDAIVLEEEILYRCGGLVRRSHRQGGQTGLDFAHASVREYLEIIHTRHPALQRYAVSSEKACKAMAILCLRCLTLENHETPLRDTPQEMDKFLQRSRVGSAYQHASMYWPRYVQEAGHECISLDIFVQRLLSIQKTPSFTAWAFEMLRHYADKPSACTTTTFYEEVVVGGLSPSSRKTFAAVVDPSFSTLHMAAAMGMATVCQALLGQGAALDQQSKFGTPLQCAVGGMSIFLGAEFESDEYNTEWLTWVSLDEQKETLQVFLEAGANVNLQVHTPFRTASLIHLGANQSDTRRAFEITAHLISAGAKLKYEDTRYFRLKYEVLSDLFSEKLESDSQEAEAVINLAVILDASVLKLPLQDTDNGPEKELRSMTRCFMEEMGLIMARPLPSQTLGRKSSVDGTEIPALVSRYIQDHDLDSLREFLKSNHRELIHHITFESGGTALHQAVRDESLDVLRDLLGFPMDVESWGRSDGAPIHLCWAEAKEDALSMLIEFGATTLALDRNNETIWHIAVAKGSIGVLQRLCELAPRDISRAMRMVNNSGQTPVCLALDSGHETIADMLAGYCLTEDCWKSPANRVLTQAATLKQPRILEILLGFGIIEDTGDEGNPLHWINIHASIVAIELLKQHYSLEQRRKRDDLTPFEAMLQLAVKYQTPPRSELVRGMLPRSLTSNFKEAKRVWTTTCRFALGVAIMQGSSCEPDWFEEVFYTLNDDNCGITQTMEQAHPGSSLLIFIESVTKTTIEAILSLWQLGRPLNKMGNWTTFSKAVLTLAERVGDWSRMQAEPSMVRLLALAILHEDEPLIRLLVKHGIPLHPESERWTPLHVASLSVVHISNPLFDFLVKESGISDASTNSRAHSGSELLCFTADRQESQDAQFKLRRLLAAGVNCDLPATLVSGTAQLPAVHHLLFGSTHSVEILLDRGANPWRSGSCLSLVGASAYLGHVAILQRIATVHGRPDKRWTQTFDLVLDGKREKDINAVHLSARSGKLGCVQFFSDPKVPAQVDARDGRLQTPMHHAAIAGHYQVIEFLAKNGCDINAADCDGRTPLHLAVISQAAEAVQSLLILHAEQRLCGDGRFPFDYACLTKNEDIIQKLQDSHSQESSRAMLTTRRATRTLADSLGRAIREKNLEACKRIHALGCPLDTEILFDLDRSSYPLPALALAIAVRTSTIIVRWLLDNHARVSITFPPLPTSASNAIEVLISSPLPHPAHELLHRMMVSYFDECMTLGFWPHRLLHFTIICQNVDNLALFLRTGLDAYSRKGKISDWSTFLNGYIDGVGDGCHKTALQLAAESLNTEAVRLLVGHGVDVHKPSKWTLETALHFAARGGCMATAEVLLKHGATGDSTNARGETSLMIACQLGHWSLVAILLRVSSLDTIRQMNRWGQTLLHHALAGHNELDSNMFKTLLGMGLPLDHVDSFGLSPLHLTLTRRSRDAFKLLLSSTSQRAQLMRMPPWPQDESLHEGPVVGPLMLTHVSRHLRHVRRRLTDRELHHMVGMDETESHTLLCRAARLGSAEAVQNLAELEPSLIKHRCKQHGMPLNAALSRPWPQSSDTVKTIVLLLDQQRISSLAEVLESSASQDAAFVKWHFARYSLCSRWISHTPANTHQEPRYWSGPWVAEVPLPWEGRQRRKESIMEYIPRRQRMVEALGRLFHPEVRLVGESSRAPAGCANLLVGEESISG